MEEEQMQSRLVERASPSLGKKPPIVVDSSVFIQLAEGVREAKVMEALLGATNITFTVRLMSRVMVRTKVRRRVDVAPGFRLYNLLGSICPPKFRERELEALHADALELYFEKLKAGDRWGAWRVKWAMRGWLLWAVFSGVATAVFSMITGKSKASK